MCLLASGGCRSLAGIPSLSPSHAQAMTYTQSEELRRQLQAAGRYMLDNALAWGNAGNLSAQLDGDTLLVTASGTHLGDLAPDDLVAVPLDASLPLPPGRKPSKEMPMHRAV